MWRIRHTGDDTYLRAECMTLVGVWVFFALLQYSTFMSNYVNACFDGILDGHNTEFSEV